jgi:cellulose biosynthesis protein BcsQ
MNRAGSVGKTTFGHSVCVQAALRGYNVLAVDADLQSDMSYWSGYDGDFVPDGACTVHDVMLGRAKLDEAIVPGRTRIGPGDSDEAFRDIPGWYLVRGDNKMSQADSELTMDPRGVFWLQLVLKNQVDAGQVDLIYVDCPASLGRLSISLLLAATDVTVCMKPTRKEMRGAAALAIAIEEIRAEYQEFGASATASYYLINEAKSHSGQGAFYLELQQEAEEMFGDRLLPYIGSSVRIPEAYSAQEPVAIWDPKAPLVHTVNSILDRFGFEDKNAGT